LSVFKIDTMKPLVYRVLFIIPIYTVRMIKVYYFLYALSRDVFRIFRSMGRDGAVVSYGRPRLPAGPAREGGA
jgi:hypothetical protein